MYIGVQTGGIIGHANIEEGYRMIREAGFEAIDWNIDTALPRNILLSSNELSGICIFEKEIDEILEHYARELKAIRDNGLVISQAHAPFPPHVSGRPEVLDYCIKIYCRCIELCHAVGCKNLIIHGISHDPNGIETVEEVKALNYRLYEGLIATLVKTDVTVCLENLPVQSKVTGTFSELLAGVCSNPSEAVEYIDTLNKKANKECFGLCLDTGHLHLCRMRFGDYVPLLNNRIKALHVHDNMGIFDSHKAPYTGSISWNDFTKEMRALGYTGDICFETFRQVTPLPDKLVPSFLKMIFETGNYFRDVICE